MFRSRLFSTSTTSRGSAQRFQYFAIVISPLMPVHLHRAVARPARSPARSGCANLAAIAYGTAGAHRRQRRPTATPSCRARILRSRAYQFAAEPESQVRIAVVGQARRQLPEHALRIDRLGRGHRARLRASSTSRRRSSRSARASGDRVFCSQQRQQRAQRRRAVADEIDLHRIAQAQHAGRRCRSARRAPGPPSAGIRE